MNWTARFSPYNSGSSSCISYSLSSVAWSGTQFVAVGEYDGTILTSQDDGMTWCTQSGPPPTLYGIVWAGTRFVAVGEGAGTNGTNIGTIYTSPDGTKSDGSTWTARRTSGPSQPLNAVAWSGTQLVTVGGNGTILTSP